jgi:peptidyl-tRNA hydrolase
MANLIQAIIVREDLNLPRGLLTAQVAHIHMESMRQMILDEKEPTNEYKEWIKTPYIHVHSVPNIEWFGRFLEKANQQLPKELISTWKDTIYLSLDDGKSREAFKDVMVGFSIGPCDADKIKAVIGDLPFLK